MKKQQVMLAILLTAGAVLVSGCVLAAVGAGAAGTVAYVKGDLEVIEAKSIDAVHGATTKALTELELSIVQDNKDAMSAMVVARDSQDKKITVKLAAVSEASTEISIRVGTFGDETKSTMIYNKIKENLK
ncbi:MAG: DUF3568 family protein [Sedimentisphaerales bacterium]|nr:DUF3568 family protein [Sedimentisphaerales bacterium]